MFNGPSHIQCTRCLSILRPDRIRCVICGKALIGGIDDRTYPGYNSRCEESKTAPGEKKKRGRPKGSKNKPKETKIGNRPKKRGKKK